MGGAYTDQLLTTIVSANGSPVAKVGGAAGGGINVVAPLTAVPNGITGNVDVSVNPGALGNATVTTLAFAAFDVTGPAVQLTTTDANPHTLATFPVAPGQTLVIDVTIIASVGVSAGVPNLNAPNAVAAYPCKGLAFRVNTAAPQSGLDLFGNSNVSAPFILPAGVSAPGLAALVTSGNSALLQVNGFAPTPWTTATAYVAGNGTTVLGQFVTSSGNVYLCTTSGTSELPAPSGTGTSGTGAVFTYVCAGSVVPVQWTMGAPRVITG